MGENFGARGNARRWLGPSLAFAIPVVLALFEACSSGLPLGAHCDPNDGGCESGLACCSGDIVNSPACVDATSGGTCPLRAG